MDPQAVVEALRVALASALDNMPDLFDGSFSPEGIAQCCADVAALSHLLTPEVGTDRPNILAYL